jgi:HEAT repeat protein
MKDEIDKLVHQLYHDVDWAERRKAALALGRLSGKEAVAALQKGLKDPDEDVLQAVVTTLTKINDPSVVEDLLKPKLLSSRSPDVRWATVLALGKMGGARAIDHLVDMLDDRDWIVRNAAAVALVEAVRILSEEGGEEVVKRFIRLLSSEDEQVHEAVARALSRMGVVSRDLLEEHLFSSSPRVRRAVARVMGELNEVEFVPPLLKAIDDSEKEVRAAVAQSLGEIGDPRAIEPLVARLGDSDKGVCQRAVGALVEIGREAVPPLIDALEHNKGRVLRKNILVTLGKLKDSRAIVPAMNNLGDSYFVVRRAAAEALMEIGEDVTDQLAEILSPPKFPIQSLLDTMLTTDNLRVRLRLIRALGELKDSRAVPALKSLLESPETRVVETVQDALEKIACAAWARVDALIVLGEIGGDRALKMAIRSLNDPNHDVRKASILMLGKLGDKRAINPLLDVLRSPVGELRRGAVRVLGLIGSRSPRVAKAINELLASDDSLEVRAEAARALGRLLHLSSIVVLIEALNDPYWTVREHAENALNNFGQKAVKALVGALHSEHDFVRVRSARILGNIGGPAALSALQTLLEDPQEAQEVLRIAQQSMRLLEDMDKAKPGDLKT